MSLVGKMAICRERWQHPSSDLILKKWHQRGRLRRPPRPRDIGYHMLKYHPGRMKPQQMAGLLSSTIPRNGIRKRQKTLKGTSSGARPSSAHSHICADLDLLQGATPRSNSTMSCVGKTRGGDSVRCSSNTTGQHEVISTSPAWVSVEGFPASAAAASIPSTAAGGAATSKGGPGEEVVLLRS